MIFKQHFDLAGKHAFLSPSNYHWINYTDEKLSSRWSTYMAARRGIELHEFAHHAIRMGVRLPKVKKTLNQYVNDAVEFRMFVEVCLYYSANCFGHADTISFYNNVLRVHDLKSGMHTASMHQLEVYAAIFCLEYGISPYEITTILRIYQSNEVRETQPHPDLLMGIMDKIIDFDKKIDLLKESGEW